MFKRSGIFVLCAALAAVFLLSWSERKKSAAQNGKITVMTSIVPLKYLAERIGGGHVSGEVMVPKGSDPHDFAPTPSLIMELSKAKIFFTAGMPFEKQILKKITGSGLNTLIVDSSTGIVRRHISHEEEEHDGHGHDEGEHENLDPHVWNSIPNLKIIAKNICDALCKESPQYSEEFRKNLLALDAELTEIQNDISKILAPFKGRTFYVFHPAFGYFADSCGLKQKAIESEGKSPTPKQLAAIIAMAEKEKVSIIFVSPQFPVKSAEAIASAIHGAVVKIDPLPSDPVANFRETALAIKKSFSTEKEKVREK